MHAETATAVRSLVAALQAHPEDLLAMQPYGSLPQHLIDFLDDHESTLIATATAPDDFSGKDFEPALMSVSELTSDFKLACKVAGKTEGHGLEGCIAEHMHHAEMSKQDSNNLVEAIETHVS